MAFAPTNTLQVLQGIPWEQNRNDVRDFDSLSVQNTYMESKVKYTFEDFTYMRHEDGHPIAVPIDTSTAPTRYEQLLVCNYIRYKNSAYVDKWFYAFITDVRYINDGVAWIYFSEDIYQTWLFDFNLQTSYVERETVEDDTVGLHTLPEPVASQDYVLIKKQVLYDISQKNLTPVIFSGDEPPKSLGGLSSVNVIDYFDVTTPSLQSGFPQGVYMSVCKDAKAFWAGSPPSNPSYTGSTLNTDEVFFKYLSLVQNVVCVLLLPSELLSYINSGARIITQDPPSIEYKYTRNITWYKKTFNLLSNSPPYAKNNKMACYPYTKIIVSNGANKVELAPNHFADQTKALVCEFVLTPQPEMVITPIGYEQYTEGVANEREISLQLSNSAFQQCMWNTDSFARWYANNKGSVGIGLVKATAALGTFALGFGDLIPSLPAHAAIPEVLSDMPKHWSNADKISTYNASVVDRQMSNAPTGVLDSLVPVLNAASAPDTSAGRTQSSVAALNIDDSPQVRYYYLRPEVGKTIDQFFSIQGYRVEEVKVPNTKSRKNWNYLKTRGAKVTGNVPDYAMRWYRSRLDEGLTFWHKNDVGNYGNLDNPIV